MVKKISSSLAASNATSSKALDRILALEAEVSRLRHHVSVLSKRLHKLDPPRRKSSRTDLSPSLGIEEDTLRSAGGGKAVEKKGVAEKLPPGLGLGGSVAGGGAEGLAMEEGLASPAEVAEPEAEEMDVASVELLGNEEEEEVAVVRLPGGKKRKIEEVGPGMVVRLGVGEELVKVPTGPRMGSPGVVGRGRGGRFGMRSLILVGLAGRGFQGIMGRGDSVCGPRGQGRGGGG